MTTAFGGITAKPGSVVRDRLTLGAFPDGTEVRLPVVMARGTRPGPSVYLQSGLHGDEVTGVALLVKVLERLDPTQMSGVVVAVPVANPAAFNTKSRGFALEERGPFDLNRIFPGSRTGVLSERIAATLFEDFLMPADFAVDFHSALAGCDIAPFTYLDPDDDEGGTLDVRRQMALAFGTPLLYRKRRGSKLGTSNMSGSIGTQADVHRKALISVEMGQSGRVSWEHMSWAVDGAINLLRHLNVVDGKAAPPAEPTEFSQIRLVHSSCGGLFEPSVTLRDEVKEGGLLGHVLDVSTQERAPVVATTDGFVLRLMLSSSVMPGAELVWIAS